MFVPRLSIAALGLALALTACATTRQSPDEAQRTGFLGDYSQLQAGGEDQAQLVYVDRGAAWSSYDAVMIDSVTIWRDERTGDVPAEDAQRLTDSLYAALHEQLKLDYRIADQPGPRVLRLRAALTEAKGSMVVMDTVTSVVPQLRLLSAIGGMAAGTAVLVGKAGVEAEITDSLSGRRLAAAVDERWGTKAIRGGIGKWSDADEAFAFWAKRLRERLAELRGEPKAD